jgi:hypothetical protein
MAMGALGPRRRAHGSTREQHRGVPGVAPAQSGVTELVVFTRTLVWAHAKTQEVVASQVVNSPRGRVPPVKLFFSAPSCAV